MLVQELWRQITYNYDLLHSWLANEIKNRWKLLTWTCQNVFVLKYCIRGGVAIFSASLGIWLWLETMSENTVLVVCYSLKCIVCESESGTLHCEECFQAMNTEPSFQISRKVVSFQKCLHYGRHLSAQRPRKFIPFKSDPWRGTCDEW